MMPLAGLRVLDLSHVLAGPYATYHLAMLGADVIKIERPPVGDAMRDLETLPEREGLTAAFHGVNAGKRSLALDLKTQAGRDALTRLIPTADVFLENFRPGKMAALGFGPEDVRALNPRIIYASISAWGQQGAMAARPGYDHVMQAATGLMWLQGDDPAAPPVKMGAPVIDMAAGMLGAIALLSAVLRRRAGDEGPIHLDVSMADAATALAAAPAWRYLLEGVAPRRIGTAAFAGSPGGGVWRTADGWLATAANTRAQFEALCGALGQPAWAAPPWLSMLPDAPDAILRGCGTPALDAALKGAFTTRGSAEWDALLAPLGVPAAPVRSPDEFLNGPYAQTGGMHADVAGVGRLLGLGFRVNGAAPAPAQGAPKLGADSADVLREAGFSADEIAALLR